MARTIHIGCCGWSYLNEHDFDDQYKKPHTSKLQAYAELFSVVEINSTFYRLPRLSTAEKWRKEADAINPAFEFTVKAYQGITHLHRFRGKESREQFEQLKAICAALKARLLLFQSPASFAPTKANMDAMRTFFDTIHRDTLILVWEPRGRWYDDPTLIAEICTTCNLIQCVDPFRNDVVQAQSVAYFRLHGFGKPSMYRYDFSHTELQQLHRIIRGLPRSTKEAYVFFNNVECYRNGREFATLLAGKRLDKNPRR
jgi:uncharacterized protein YecE (DUF72 family)